MSSPGTVSPHGSVSRRRSPALRLLLAGLLAVAAAGAIVWGVEWWRAWPLRDAEQALAAGNPTRAEALTGFYLDQHADDPRALAIKGQALVALGDGAAAAAIYETIGAASAADVHAWAQAYLLTESWSRAKHLLEQFLRMQPGDPEATYELATCTARLGSLDEAVEAARQYAALPGCNTDGALLEAIFHHDRGDSSSAADAFARVLALSPEATGLQLPPEEIFLQYGNALLDQGRPADAVPLFERSNALRPSGEASFRLGRALAQSGKPEAAAAAWRMAIEIQPQSVSSREALADAALAEGNLDAAADWLSPLEPVAAERAETSYLFQRLAAAREDTAGFDRWKAIADTARKRQQRTSQINQFIVAAPTDPWAIAVRAHRFAAAGNWQQATDLLEGLPLSFKQEPFVHDLEVAVRDRSSSLPSLDLVPVNEP